LEFAKGEQINCVGVRNASCFVHRSRSLHDLLQQDDRALGRYPSGWPDRQLGQGGPGLEDGGGAVVLLRERGQSHHDLRGTRLRDLHAAQHHEGRARAARQEEQTQAPGIWVSAPPQLSL